TNKNSADSAASIIDIWYPGTRQIAAKRRKLVIFDRQETVRHRLSMGFQAPSAPPTIVRFVAKFSGNPSAQDGLRSRFRLCRRIRPSPSTSAIHGVTTPAIHRLTTPNDGT